MSEHRPDTDGAPSSVRGRRLIALAHWDPDDAARVVRDALRPGVTLAEAAAVLGVSLRWLQAFCARNAIPRRGRGRPRTG